MEVREKVLTFLTHKSKPRVVQTMLLLVKLLSGQYHSYSWTQLDLNGKSLCKYYISMILMIFKGSTLSEKKSADFIKDFSYKLTVFYHIFGTKSADFIKDFQ